MLRTGISDREPVFLRFLLSVGDDDEFVASFFLKGGLFSVSVSLSMTILRLSRVCEFLSTRAIAAQPRDLPADTLLQPHHYHYP